MIRATFVCVLLAAPAAAQGPLPADWDQRDLEGRWVAWRSAVAGDEADPAVRTAWLEAIGRRGDDELLEWIAIYEPRRGSATVTPLSVLVARDSPRWLRVAAWQLPRHPDSHNKDEAERVLEAHREQAWSWIHRHRLEDRPGLGRVLASLRDDPPRTVDVSRFLPPIAPEPLVLAWLDAPPDLVEFGARLRAEQGVRYVHQVERAIDGLLQGSLYDEPYPTKLYGLTEHALQRIRRKALLALADLPPQHVPFARLDARLARERDPAERRLVAMALGRAAHPAAALRMLDLLEDADDPARWTAAQRIADAGGPYAAARLAELAATDDELRAVSERATARIAAVLRDVTSGVPAVRTWVERAAHARAVGDPRADAMREALCGAVRGLPDKVAQAVGAELDRLAAGDEEGQGELRAVAADVARALR